MIYKSIKHVNPTTNDLQLYSKLKKLSPIIY